MKYSLYHIESQIDSFPSNFFTDMQSYFLLQSIKKDQSNFNVTTIIRIMNRINGTAVTLSRQKSYKKVFLQGDFNIQQPVLFFGTYTYYDASYKYLCEFLFKIQTCIPNLQLCLSILIFKNKTKFILHISRKITLLTA